MQPLLLMMRKRIMGDNDPCREMGCCNGDDTEWFRARLCDPQIG